MKKEYIISLVIVILGALAHTIGVIFMRNALYSDLEKIASQYGTPTDCLAANFNTDHISIELFQTIGSINQSEEAVVVEFRKHSLFGLLYQRYAQICDKLK